MAEATPNWEAYSCNSSIAGPFENKILYAMCQANPAHSDPYVTAGKITAIGRIYAAAPERGAGRGREAGSLADVIARHLAASPLDAQLEAIPFAERFSDSIQNQVVETHKLLVQAIVKATLEWTTATYDPNWSPRSQASFSSKYLHFHRPNAFPIMDSYAKAGLACAGVKGQLNTYERFCDGIARHVDGEDSGWTLRSMDSALVDRGRKHSDRSGLHCSVCNVKFAKRSRTKKSADTNGD